MPACIGTNRRRCDRGASSALPISLLQIREAVLPGAVVWVAAGIVLYGERQEFQLLGRHAALFARLQATPARVVVGGESCNDFFD